MPNFNFTNVKGLTAADRAQWEKDNIEQLNKMNYSSLDDTSKELAFKNAAFKNKFGNRSDYAQLKTLSPEKRDSLYMASPSDNIEDLDAYQDAKQHFSDMYNKWQGTANKAWESFDKKAREVSNYYQRFAGTEYLPLTDESKVDMMSTYEADLAQLGQEAADKNLADRIKTQVSENQPLIDKLSNGFWGGVNSAGASVLSGASSILGAVGAALGVDRLLGEEQAEGYWENIWKQAYDNPWTQYFDRVMKQGTWFNQSESPNASDALEIIRTAEEDENLASNIFSVNTIPELMKNSGFTIGSMIEGAGLVKLGNMAFNTARYATLAGKSAKTVADMERINKTLGELAKWQRRYNAYAVPGLVGSGEGLINALDTKNTYIQDAQKMLAEAQSEAVNNRVNELMKDIKIPEDVRLNGQEELFLNQVRTQLEQQALEELQPAYEDSMNKIEKNADSAAFVNFVINSFINGFANVTLKAPMFGGKVTEALSRSRVGKLFTSDKFKLDEAGNVIANKLSKKQMAWNAAKESLGEAGEEYSQTISDEFARGGAESDLSNYLEQRYNGVSDDAITDSLWKNIGSAFAAAGKASISKDAIQSGIYGALGQMMGTPNVNAVFSKSDRVNVSNKEGFWNKAGAITRNIYRNPFVESINRDKQENNNREESAKALNDWLNQGNNRERLTSLKGSIAWAKSMQDAADKGDEFSYRNSRLGKLVQDYFMLEQLKETPLYDAYMQQYMDILNAKEGDEMSKQIAKYDSRPLADIQKDAQNMLNVMQKVQEATADLEKSLGNSIPQEVKESLIYGKLSIDDWRERASQLEQEIKKSYGEAVASPITEEASTYIARNGSLSQPTGFDKEIDKIQLQINTLEKNKSILSNSQKKTLKSLNEQLETFKNNKKKALKDYQRVLEGIGTDIEPILRPYNIIYLNPIDRYRMLNPENRNKYSKEQQRIIENLIETGTANTSDFMNKIEDAARINDAQRVFYKQYNEALRNPNIMINIANALKLSNRFEDLTKSYKKINDIKDYASFAKAIDNALIESQGDEREAILNKTLKGNPLYDKYLKDEELANGIYEQLVKNSAFKDISDEDKVLVQLMSKFLARKGIDISDSDKAIEALTSADSNGKSNLVSYIDELNQNLPDNLKISLDNIGTIVNNYKRALQSYKDNEQVKEQINKTPEDKPVEAVKPEVPQVGIFGSSSAFSSAEEAGKSSKETDREEEPTKETTNKTDNTQGILSLDDSFINNNSSEVVSAAEKLVNDILNTGEPYSDEDKKEAIDLINQRKDRTYSSPEEFRQEIFDTATSMINSSTKGGDKNERIGSLLQRNSIATTSQTKKEDKSDNESKTKETPKSNRNITLAQINSTFKGVMGNLYREWKIDEFLRSNTLSRKSGQISKIFYISLDNVTSSVKQEMGDSYNEEEHLPVIAIVENENGPITIKRNGKDIKYQPIGFLPASSKDTRAGRIRELAKNQSNRLIASGNTLLNSTVIIASPMRTISKRPEDDKDFNELIYDALTPEERKVIDNPDGPVEKTEKQAIVNRWISFVASRLRAGKNKKGEPTLFYNEPTMKGDNSITHHPILTKNVSETTNGSGKHFADVVSEENSKAIINFNSRTYGFARELLRLVQNNNWSEVSTDGKIFIGEGGTIDRINSINNTLNRFLYSSYSKYSIKPEVINGKLGISLYLGDTKLGIISNDVNGGVINENDVATIISKLLLDGNNYREGVNWQVDKDPSFWDPSSEHYNLKDVENIIRDNILRVGLDSLNREISGVEVTVPEGVRDPKPINPKPEVTNSDNASESDSSSGTANTQSGKKVDTDTGLTDEGKTVKNEAPLLNKEAVEISKKIEADSHEIQLTPEGDSYTNTRTGETYARVTSVINADEQAGEKFDPNSPWILPSTNIGTGIDEFIRDFFSGKFDKVTDDLGTWDPIKGYPNASPHQYNKLRKQLQKLKNYLDAQGLTVIPRDVTVTGTVQVTNNGKTYDLPIAGTLDLLAYDKDGNFYIFDMKSHHATTISEEKRDKWARQLSLYKQLLENKYGIKISSLNIIPIKVDYPNPSSKNKYEVVEGNQISLNGKEFYDTNPTLGEVGSISETQVKIDYNKLDDKSKSLLKERGSKAITSQPIVQPKKGLKVNRKPIVKKANAVPIKVEDNPIGTTFENLTEEQQESLRLKYSDIPGIEDFFNSWSEEEKQHELKCLG